MYGYVHSYIESYYILGSGAGEGVNLGVEVVKSTEKIVLQTIWGLWA